MVPRIFKNLDFKFATHYVWLRGTVGKLWVQPDFKANELYRRTFFTRKVYSKIYSMTTYICTFTINISYIFLNAIFDTRIIAS